MKFRLLFLSLFALSVLSGCGTFVERVLEPSQIGTKTVSRHDRTGVCLNLDTSVIPAPTRPPTGEVLFGYENRIARGADPIPCNTRHNYAHQALVQFNLAGLTAPGEIVTDAVLEGESRFIALMPETFITRDCTSRFQRPTEAWAPGDFTGPPGDVRARIPADGSGEWRFPSGALGAFALNVGSTVQAWGRGRPNHGFTFVSPEAHELAEENLHCVFTLQNLRLRVTVFVPDSP